MTGLTPSIASSHVIVHSSQSVRPDALLPLNGESPATSPDGTTGEPT